MDQLIEFEVEMNQILFSEGRGKDLTVNWKMYDGFDPNGKFWTDSNGLMMMERELNVRHEYKMVDFSSNISSNYYPVTSAIAMRDANGTDR